MKYNIEKINTNQHLIYLENGLRLIYTYNPNTLLVHCGYLIGAGSRNETPDINGMAHFIEHTAFKGTKKRKSKQVFDYLETVGGELNAYTTREKTSFYASVLNKYFERAVDLLTDIVFYPVFPTDEIEKEKGVIFEEIDMYLDSPEESIYDDFHTKIFGEKSLGLTILGKKDCLKEIDREKVGKFRGTNYCTNNIVFSVVGNLKMTELEKMIDRYLIDIVSSESIKKNKESFTYKPFQQDLKKKFQQVHCVIGNIGFDIGSKEKYPMMVLNNILGGDWMSSRLNLILREKYAFVYSISSNSSVYLDTGLFTIQFGTDEKHMSKCLKLISSELLRFQEKMISSEQLNRAKRQILSQYAMLDEKNSFIMQSQARNILDYQRIITKEEFFENLNRITTEHIWEIANLIFDSKKLSRLIYRNEKVVTKVP